ncbi:unnamed protein product [Phaedon cochleariae]|uniref:Myotubularin phosphatase domain-containing protein n=1 Tax=Phaedon cochleariae TaxID=80249 RepID=A0A9N9X3I6_PHACE|nr:unnamed protein product [Phaedon cochleariae]
MNDIKEDSRFKSYIGESELLESITLNDAQRTKFLEGETVVCEAPKVLMYPPLSDRKKYIAGVLTVTTFKLSFASAVDQDPSNCHQHNLLLGVNDVCLSSIDVIYQIGDRTRKKLSPGQNVTGKVKDILIVCKNMKCLELSFKMCDKDSGKTIVNALLHHAYPKRHTLLFAYDYKEPYVNNSLHKEARFYQNNADWDKELKRTKCPNWRTSQVNYNYQTSPLLIETMIVPKSVSDSIINEAVEKFRNRFCPLWVWGTHKGAALVRMADLLPTITDRTEENKLLEHIRKSHPEKKPPHIIDLSSPTPKDIQSSFMKLRDLCTPENTRVFKSQDFKFYGLLDNTKWLLHVSTCLTKALEAAEHLSSKELTVVLQEDVGSPNLGHSLIIITKKDDSSLVQKEWVALGHPFANRLGHILCKDIEPSPIFLLFLDAVWQLLQQYPQAFQISETYLTSLWDAAHVSIFDTFLFNCHHARCMAEKQYLQAFQISETYLTSLWDAAHVSIFDTFLFNCHHARCMAEKISETYLTSLWDAAHVSILDTFLFNCQVYGKSVWDWREQFSERDIGLFCNPLYDDSFREALKPNTGLSGLENKEVRVIPTTLSSYNDIQVLPSFQYDPPSANDLNHYIITLLTSQLQLAKEVCSSTQFSNILKQRLLILKRIYHALIKKYHDKDKSECFPCEPSTSSTSLPLVSREVTLGSEALLEVGVKTGLSFLFSLLQQNWQVSGILGIPSLCNSVLETTVDLIQKLPPLCLSNDSQLTNLGTSSLEQVCDFLRNAVLQETAADKKGKLLSCEILLGLALQRGSLRYLLDWIDMALEASCEQPDLSSKLAKKALAQLEGSRNKSKHSSYDDGNEEIVIYRVAICLMETLVNMALDYGGACSIVETSAPEADSSMYEKSDVYIEAGQYCTFAIHVDGCVSACGKGSYGRLGLGESSNQSLPKHVRLDAVVKRLSSSKGCDGHTLALTESGHVFSWGDGDYGKLGHGNCATHKQPERITGPFAGTTIKYINAGYRHSAAITEEGRLYTWGEGDHGRLGHLDNNGRHVPTLVADLADVDVGTVACGSSHTLVVSRDGKTVWSFGSGENGKLGHGEIAKVYRPKVIEALQGLVVQKVCAGTSFSMALTTMGQVRKLFT